MFVIVAFCMGTIIYCLWNDSDTEVAQSAVSMAFVIIGTTIASYVFGAAWQDISQPFNMRNEREPYYETYYGRSSVYGMPVEDDHAQSSK